MRRIKTTEQRVALICAVVLVVVTAAALWRHYDIRLIASSDSQTVEQTSAHKEASDKPVSDQSQAGNQVNTDTNKKQQNADMYHFTAVAGSTYTGFARQAIAQYATAHSWTVSEQQALEAEIALANTAGSPLLEVGQQVALRHADIARVLAPTDADTSKASSATETPPDVSDDITQIATAGDSYTMLARRAVARYADSHKQTLSPAQRAATEAQLTAQAGAPQVEIGQQVVFAETALKQVVQAAQALTPAESLQWQSYADTIMW